MDYFTGRNVVVILFSLAISGIDGTCYRIPNPLLACFFLFIFFMDFSQSFSSFFYLERLGSIALVFTLFYAVYYYSGGLGYGDVKLAAILGYILGYEKAFMAFFFTAISGILVYIVGIKIFHWEKSAKIPFAPFLCAGAVIASLFRFSIMSALK